MFILTRFVSALFTALPALGFGILILIEQGNEYYWPAYIISGTIFLIASLVLGLFLPSLLQKLHISSPWIWLFVQGFLAWLMGVAMLFFINLTPLCVGQDNGDGNNDLAICIVQSVLVALISSPVEFFLLVISGFTGGKVLTMLLKRG